MKSKVKIYLAAALVILASCNKQLNPLLTDPSKATPAAADNDLYLNNLQLYFRSFYQRATDFGDQMVRQEVMFGPTYFNAFTPSNFDDIWNEAYMSVFLSANTMIPLAEAKGQYKHAAIAQVLKAYTMVTLVDLFGDVPYSEAVKGVANTNPKVDPGKSIYDSALALLDSAIANFAKTSSATPTNDLFYNGDATSWTKLAKTLKLKTYIQERLVDASVASKISALVAEDDLINAAKYDFVYSYSTHAVSPDARAPHYASNYGASTGTSDYIGTYFMWALQQEKSMPDPRTRYYLYRQIVDINNDSRLPNQTTTQFAIPCLYRASPYPAGTCYCIVGTGYVGRDHGNNEGIPPDGALRTTWGVYPAGGEFDANQNKPAGTATTQVHGAGGNGINPIWLSSYTYFLKAEAALLLSAGGDPRDWLTKGVNASFSKVSGFASGIGYTLPTTDTNLLITPTKQNKYVGIVQGLYDGASSNDDKLNVIMKEYYLAAWGNGVEPYNNYRRTGKPNNFQPALGGNAGSYIRSFFYPSVYVNYNKNATQKTAVNVKVFWDNNPDNFVQ
ncbi:MAG: SusD/RagB family nutrient-binding outer membrane lipoprotein [Chitinophagaceae bacterium]|nr:SusD/RagB family nutrient-binding outer membrane lipoprotein [Chitinophagaceae bacterium]